jgi:hypothetical protein
MTVMTDQTAVLEMYDEVGANITSLIAGVARRTERDDVQVAAEALHRTLAHAGIRAGDDWCRRVIDTLRRGEQLTIELE